jgi:ABC-type transport system substrate-binding protein
MFAAFVSGDADITDWPVQSPSDEASFGANPDMWLTDGQSEFGIFELDINHATSILGAAQQEARGADAFNSASTKQPTAAGVEVRRALAHLIDKPDFENVAALAGRAEYVDVQAPVAQGVNSGGATPSTLSAAERALDCAAHPWFTPCDASNPPISAYNLVADSLASPIHSFADRGYSGTADRRAACDHLVLAGVAPGGTDCAAVAADTANIASAGRTMTVYIRTHPPRKAAGTLIMDGLNSLFDANVHTLDNQYFTISQVSDIVFRTAPDVTDWHAYTGGWSLGSTPDHLYALYHSLFASSICGAKRSTFAQNYLFYCSPAYDDESRAGQFSATFPAAGVHFAAAAVLGHRNVMTVPFYGGAGLRFVALNGWNFQPGTESSLVSQLGHGFQSEFYSSLNMRQKPGYVAANPQYTPGGGNPNLIRSGFSQEVRKLSLFHATTVWDFKVIEKVYDSMLAGNPTTGGVGLQLVDWMTTKHTSSFDPNEVFAGVTGITTQTWTLRNDLKWHDGVAVDSGDVVFTIVKYRDIPSANLAPSVIDVLAATAIDARTVQVKLRGQSAFFELNIGGLPIIPEHKWGPLGDGVMGDPAFDPMNPDNNAATDDGVFIGSGPWMCKSAGGHIGGTCTETAAATPGGQEVSLGGRIRLTRFTDFQRGLPGVAETSLHKYGWADKNNDGKVDLLDIADAAFSFNQANAYWNTGQNLAAPQTVGVNPAVVDIGEIALIAFYFDHGLTKPFLPGSLNNLDPDIDPFF